MTYNIGGTMKEVIGIGKTIAIAEIEAMRTLGIGNDERITMELLEVPVKGVLGIWGNQLGKIKLNVEIKNPIIKIDTSDIKSEKEKATRLLGEDFNESIIFWAAIYAVKINQDITASMAVQTINALWQKNQAVPYL